MDSSKIALLVETALGAAHDIILELAVGDLPQPEPDPEVTYAPEDKLAKVIATATDPGNAFANDYLFGMANGLLLAQAIVNDTDVQYLDRPETVKPSNAACDVDPGPAAVSEDFAAGMAHARRQFAGQEEDRYAKERAAEIDRMDLQRHVEMRMNAMSAAVALTAAGHGTESTIVQAQAIYDFFCFGAVQANLGCATNMELSDELAARYKLGHGQPDYRSVGSL